MVVATVIANVLLGLLILLRDTKKPYSIPFFIFTFWTSLWSIMNLLTDYGSPHLRYMFDKGAFVGAFLAICSFTWFVVAFTRFYTRALTALLIGLSAAMTIIVIDDREIVEGVKAVKSGTETISGNLYNLYLYMIVILVLFSLIVLHIHKNKLKDYTQKLQISWIQFGVGVAALLGVLFNGILPYLLHDWRYAKLGPFATVVLVATISFAIIKHRLFDIRLIVARSIAYLTSLIVLAAVYGFLVFGASNLIFHLHFPVGVQIFIAAATAVASLSFANIKSFFDRVTNKLFFRDSYDTQAFLDEFNKTLVVTYELDQLLKESAKIIGENIKPVHCLFVVNETENTKSRVFGSGDRGVIAQQDVPEIRESISRTKQKLIVADELEDKHEALQKLLRRKDIVIVARLASSSSSAKSDVGYLMLGPKNSGNLYSSQDLKVIEIVANELVIAVQNALRFEEIENFNITLQAKVDEATRKLRRVNERLKTLDETKDDFISMASHQLRTPLTSVKGYISLILEGDAGKITPVQRKMLQQAFFSSQQMVYLIADLLNVSRLRTGKFVIQPSPVHLARVISEELSQLKESAKLHSIKLEFKPPKDFPQLMLDETKTRQVIMNFIDNAIYYTPPGGTIDVQLLDKGPNIELRVTDSGIGVPKAEQPHLFTKFYRAANARKARPDGTGLGLFMARKVIVAQGGSIIFDSQEGKGSTFGFTFKKSKAT
jgi:signal transduction histidine kinase